MKKILLFCSLFLISLHQVGAMNPADYLNKIPDNFKGECYENYNKIDKSEVRDNKKNEKYKTYKISLDKLNDLTITQFGFILPYKFHLNNKDFYSYKNNLGINNLGFIDNNLNTYEEINTQKQKELILTFDEKLTESDFSFNFNYSSNNYLPSFYISENNKNWSLVKKENIESFGFKYLKIKFESITKKEFAEKIKIYELNFTKKTNTILVKSFFNENIEFYSNFNCKEKDFNTSAKKYNVFPIDTNTKIINLNLVENPKYNVYSKKDYDNDWIEDEIDNCKHRYNPKQKDSNGDGIGDMCSDVDKDGFIGYYDNCPYISNKNQKDVNNNLVGDACEFDKDLDGIYDSIDNCITTKNKDQKDEDFDGIGDLCDNCKLHNPSQIDKNNNGLGDFCEDEELKLIKNDDDSDGIINYKDNCKDIKNKDQKDSDLDGVGDACDNCKNIKNSDQKDIDENNIGDFCEDIDLDNIIGYRDNCVYLANENQKDDDNNGIGNSCEDKDSDNIWNQKDNCPYKYNPEQKDIDNDGIGDKCDENDNRYIESNKSIFIGLIILITIIFGGFIIHTIKKIK